TDMEAKTHKRGKSIMVTLDDGTGYLQCRMGQNIVKGIDKWKNQQTVKRLYINGESNIKADLHKSLDNSDITAIPEPEKNRVYMFDITYSPSYDDGAPRVQVNTVLPVNLSDDGKLPVRLRFDESDNSKAANKLKSKLPQALAKKYPGDYPIMTTVYNSNEQHINAIEPDQVYLDAFAVIEADSDESTSVDDEYQDYVDSQNNKNLFGENKSQKSKTKKSKKAKTREWPPKRLGDDSDYSTNIPFQEFVEQIEYVDSGLKTDKTKAVEKSIEKYLGAENYDFGVSDPTGLY